MIYELLNGILDVYLVVQMKSFKERIKNFINRILKLIKEGF